MAMQKDSMYNLLNLAQVASDNNLVFNIKNAKLKTLNYVLHHNIQLRRYEAKPRLDPRHCRDVPIQMCYNCNPS